MATGWRRVPRSRHSSSRQAEVAARPVIRRSVGRSVGFVFFFFLWFCPSVPFFLVSGEAPQRQEAAGGGPTSVRFPRAAWGESTVRPRWPCCAVDVSELAAVVHHRHHHHRPNGYHQRSLRVPCQRASARRFAVFHRVNVFIFSPDSASFDVFCPGTRPWWCNENRSDGLWFWWLVELTWLPSSLTTDCVMSRGKTTSRSRNSSKFLDATDCSSRTGLQWRRRDRSDTFAGTWRGNPKEEKNTDRRKKQKSQVWKDRATSDDEKDPRRKHPGHRPLVGVKMEKRKKKMKKMKKKKKMKMKKKKKIMMMMKKKNMKKEEERKERGVFWNSLCYILHRLGKRNYSKLTAMFANETPINWSIVRHLCVCMCVCEGPVHWQSFLSISPSGLAPHKSQHLVRHFVYISSGRYDLCIWWRQRDVIEIPTRDHSIVWFGVRFDVSVFGGPMVDVGFFFGRGCGEGRG